MLNKFDMANYLASDNPEFARIQQMKLKEKKDAEDSKFKKHKSGDSDDGRSADSDLD